MAKIEGPKINVPPKGYVFSLRDALLDKGKPVAPADTVVVDAPSPVLSSAQVRRVNRLWWSGTADAPKQFPESVLFVVAGGNAPGQNAFLKSAMQPLIDNGVKVMVAWGGIQTLLEESPHIVEITQSDLDHVDLLSGSVFIGTSRAPKTRQDPTLIDKIAAAIKASGVQKVVMMGGDGTLKLAEKLVERGIPIIGAPKTMDGNLAIKLNGHLERVYSLGFLSSVEKAAKYATLLDTWGKQNKQIVVMEINGRDTGWITYETARKTGLPCFILEQKVSFADLYNKVKEMSETGGVLMVSESLEIIDRDGKVLDLQKLAYDPVHKDPADMIGQYLTGHGENIRSINLTPLADASLGENPEAAQNYIREMAVSAASQERINVVSLATEYINQLGVLPSHVYLVTNESTLEELRGKLVARSQKPDVILVANDHSFSDANPYWEQPKTDSTGRVHYATRNLSGYLSAWINTLKVKATHFVATHLLMAGGTAPGDAVHAGLMAQAVVSGLVSGVEGKIVSFVEGHPTALLLPLTELENYQIPLEVTQADNHHNYVSSLVTLLDFLRDTPRSVFNKELVHEDSDKVLLNQEFDALLNRIHALPRKGDFVVFARELILTRLGSFLQTLMSHFCQEQKIVVQKLRIANAEKGEIKSDEFLQAMQPLLISIEQINDWWAAVKEGLADFMDLPQAQSAGGRYHDFRNRVGPLIGFSSMAADGSFDDAGTYIASGMLDPPANIRQLVSELARDPKNMQRGAEIYEKQDGKSVTIPDIPSSILEELKSVLMEFVNNGVKYGREGQKPRVSVQITHDDKSLKLIVADNGIGMSQEFIDKRYGKSGERERRIADPDGFLNEGWGVADAIRRIESLGGTVKAESFVGEGSTITIEIPHEALQEDVSVIVSHDDEISSLDIAPLEETWQTLESQAAALARLPVIPSPYLSSPVLRSSVVVPWLH